ncbi:sugar porter family MFS transporter, partial [Thioclava sp. BHET1]
MNTDAQVPADGPERGETVSRKLVLVAGTAALGGFLFGYDSSIVNGTV